MMKQLVLIAALAACGGGDAKPAPDAAIEVRDVPPVTRPGEGRVGGEVLTQVDDVRWIVDTAALVDLAVEAPGHGGVYTPRGLRLVKVEPGTILAQLGLQGGDVIAGVRDPDALQAAWLNLRNGQPAVFTIERGTEKLERRLFLRELLFGLTRGRHDTTDPVRQALIDAMRTGVQPGKVDRAVVEAFATPSLVAGTITGARYGRDGVALDHDSPLTALGLTGWDEVREVNGRPTPSALELGVALAAPPGPTLSIAYTRIKDPLVLELQIVDGIVDRPALDAALAAWKAEREQVDADRAARDAAAAALSAEYDQHIQKIDDTHFTVDRRWLDKLVDDPTAVMKGARVVPAVKNGKANGFKIYAIRPSSIFAKLGLSNGDTIERVNGRAIDAQSADAVWRSVKNAKTVTFDITRRGKPVVIEYTLR